MSQWDGSLYTMNRDGWMNVSEIFDGNQNFIDFALDVSFEILPKLDDKV